MLPELDGAYLKMAVITAYVVVACSFIQRTFRKELERDQYYYLRDISLIAAWAICGIWAQSAPMKLTITAGVIAGLVGFCQKVVKNWDLRFCYLAIGLGVALLGPRITFIGRPDGEFLYISSFTAIIVLSTLWMGFFPILFQEFDEIPGMGGGLLLVSWTIMTAVTALSSKGLSDALMMSLCGLALILVFWSRHVSVYRRLGSPLAAIWGTLLAGTSVLGASKGVAFATVMILPLGLFAIPIIETSLSVLSAAFSPKPLGNMLFYRWLVRRGFDHPAAVFFVSVVCAVCGASIAVIQMRLMDPFSLGAVLLLTGAGLYIAAACAADRADGQAERPSLWGVEVDNVSLDYALGRVAGWAMAAESPQMIVTVDALAALRSRADGRYAMIVRSAAMSLPDGAGLIWALRSLGFTVQEKISGVDFAEHLCRLAAGHGWPVFFLGGRPGVAEEAARRMAEKYAGIEIAGCLHGYFKQAENERVCEAIKKSGARILFVALGVPAQEYWFYENKAKLGNVVGIGVGGTFDVLSGRLRRAPEAWRRMKLEWFYRTIQEPRRWRRVVRLPLFVFLVFMKKMRLDLWKPQP
ncbi:MAG: WecB/TagA/CpsF family glycosyltransferase [Synergistaceae bacterium]|jgi:N-acetylglucosaminyldiphosphoundecaprenol N-acetyl-beta-D-mannosaminyltransferase|nr:WecB/TagA/CpsF family glycosyltransferase [Synergistaceae bacterium]